MKWIFRLLGIFLLAGNADAQIYLPICSGVNNSNWTNCYGTTIFSSGARYEGTFLNGLPHGYGRIIQPSGLRYVGEWIDGKVEGEGIEYNANGTVWQSGFFRFNGTSIRHFQINQSRFPFHGQIPALQTYTGLRTTDQVASSSQPENNGSIQLNAQKVVAQSSLPERCVGEYPFLSRRLGEEGVVHLRFEINLDGSTRNVEIVKSSGIKRLDEAALKTIALCKFTPPTQSQSNATANKISRISITYKLTTQTESAQPSSFQSESVSTEAQAERQRVQELEQQLALERQRNSEKPNENQRPQLQATPKPERRVALVIGNSTYKVNPLENPANDATDIAENLTKAGFTTTLIRNATLGQMRDATRRFADQLPSSDVALIYFAGHGIESNRKNYMIPVNADLKFEYELSDQAYDASVWLEMLESVKSSNSERVNIVILDACRNNTLFGARSLGRGLGRMDAPTGTFLAFSTAPGKVAADGAKGERNSPFTKHLLRAMQRPGLPIEEVFKEVRRNVSRETTGAQVPWESTSLTGFFAFRQ